MRTVIGISMGEVTAAILRERAQVLQLSASALVSALIHAAAAQWAEQAEKFGGLQALAAHAQRRRESHGETLDCLPGMTTLEHRLAHAEETIQRLQAELATAVVPKRKRRA